MKNILPNFLIVGAAKSGTSSLHNYLTQHPQVFMPTYNQKGMKVKEPRFLIKDLVQYRLHNGIWSFEEYQSLFSNVKNEIAIGESTVLYLYYFEHAIKNIKRYLGNNVRIIIMLRNPTDRAYSAFHHVSRGFKESYSFEESLDLEIGRLERDKNLTPMVMYKEMGMYYKMVKAYKDSFKNVHVIFYEDFRDNIKLEMDKVYNFLGISRDIKIDLKLRYNVGGRRWKSQKLKYLIKDSNYIKSLMKFILPRLVRNEIYNFLVKILSREVKPLNEVTKKALNDYFKEDVTQLSKLLDKDLKNWMN